jgi:hypothetical protein
MDQSRHGGQGLPSARGLGNLKSDPMLDLQKAKEEYPVYDAGQCPDGVIDISTAANKLMIPELRRWAEEKRPLLLADIEAGMLKPLRRVMINELVEGLILDRLPIWPESRFARINQGHCRVHYTLFPNIRTSHARLHRDRQWRLVST